MRVSIYILFSLFALTSCQKFTWNNPYDIATPKSVFTPDGLVVRQEGENLLLSWNQDNSNISGFKLFRSIDRGVSTELVSLNKSTLSYTDANIQGGKTYTYTLKAYADKNESNEVSTEILAKSRPTINTIAASAITENTATSGGAIVSDGGSPITSKGLVWSTSVNPTIDLTTKTNDGSGSGAFERILTNLSPSTIYYLRAYATNSVGTAYGNQLTFTTGKPPVPPILESLSQGLIAYYPFNGNTNDESGNGYNAVSEGASLTVDRKGNLNTAYSFKDGVMSINLNSTNFEKDFTISIWAQLDEMLTTDPCLINSEFLSIMYSGNSIYSFLFTNIGIVGAFSAAVDYTKWHNITFMRKSDSTRFFLNGTYLGYTPIQKSVLYPSNRIYLGRINGNTNPPNFRFKGKLDDIRFYNRALTQEEITYLANN